MISNRSPTFPRSVVPGAVPSNVHSVCFTPGATSRIPSRTVNVYLCMVPDVAGGSTGSRASKLAAGFFMRSMSPAADGPSCAPCSCPPASGESVGVGVAAGPPIIFTFMTMPSCRWPAIEHHPSMSDPTTPTSTFTVCFGFMSPDFAPLASTRSCTWLSLFVSTMTSVSPAGTFTTSGWNRMSFMLTSTVVVCPVGVTATCAGGRVSCSPAATGSIAIPTVIARTTVATAADSAPPRRTGADAADFTSPVARADVLACGPGDASARVFVAPPFACDSPAVARDARLATTARTARIRNTNSTTNTSSESTTFTTLGTGRRYTMMPRFTTATRYNAARFISNALRRLASGPPPSTTGSK